MKHPGATRLDTLAAAEDDHASVLAFTQELVRIPSRGGIDSYAPILEAVESWLTRADLECRRIADTNGAIVGLACDISGDRPGPRYVLNACLDTAPFGDEASWAHPPTSAVVENGWLYGRGSADSKAAVSIFCHLAARLHGKTDQLRGSVTVFFDADEHTGHFGGARAYFSGADAPDDVAGVYIGYPGVDEIVVGGRGVLRAWFVTAGVAGHSGSSRATPNAIDKAADLVRALRTVELPEATTPDFPLPPKLTVTRIEGGEGFSVVPDTCRIAVDLRLTPTLDVRDAETLLRTAATVVDTSWPATKPTSVETVMAWPPYRLPVTSPLVQALHDGARAVGLRPRVKVAGPSNIGNYLAGLGIQATAGFGVAYDGLHGTDERIRVDTLPVIQAAYHDAVLTLLTAEA